MLRPERTMLLHITRGGRFIVISGGDGASGRVCTRWKKQWASHWLFTAHFPQKMYLGGFGHKLLMRTLWQWQSFYPAVHVRQRQKFRKNQERKERRLMVSGMFLAGIFHRFSKHLRILARCATFLLHLNSLPGQRSGEPAGLTTFHFYMCSQPN